MMKAVVEVLKELYIMEAYNKNSRSHYKSMYQL